MKRGTGTISCIISLLLLLTLAAHVPLASAKVTYYVGSCASGSYSTISAALAATPPPKLVYICPGTYPEQLLITYSVTLEGIFTSNSGQAFITVPSGGLSLDNACGEILNQPTQVCVNSAGTVNLSNITVDGSGASYPVGIMYNNSSGTMNHIETRFQEGKGLGMGIEVQGTANTVTVENSNLHNFDLWGIFAEDTSDSASELTLKIEGNTLAADSIARFGIVTSWGKSVTISDNIVNGPSAPSVCLCGGIGTYTPVAGSITKNIVAGVGSGGAAITLLAGVDPTTLSVTSNTIFNVAGDAIQLNPLLAPVPPVTIDTNVITQAQNGINFECDVDNTISSNTISAIHSYGVANVPSGVNSPNTYYNVPTLYSTCD